MKGLCCIKFAQSPLLRPSSSVFFSSPSPSGRGLGFKVRHNPHPSRLRRTCFRAAGLVVLVALFAFAPGAAAQTCAENSAAVNNRGPSLAGDCTTLLGLRDELRGSASLNWAEDVNMDDWNGISVGDTPARVTQLDLDFSGLTGTIPAALGDLTGLTYLNLNDNDLTGSTPDLSALTSLTHLDLSDNQLTGSIPAALDNLTTLTHLNLSNNNFTAGPITVWINSLPNLITLNLRNTNRTGTIPTSGIVPPLEVLDLGGNQLSGSIPISLRALHALTHLYLDNNQLSGSILNLNALTALEVLDLSNNNFAAGPIPAWITSLTNLIVLELSNTNRTGTIPNLSALTRLRFLHLDDNAFTAGPIPSWVTTLTNLIGLDLSNTNRTGPIPDLSALTSLAHLDLSGNNFTSSVVGRFGIPGHNSFQSGVGVLSGWVCEADEVVIEIDDGTVVEPQVAAYGTERLDTEGDCGDTDNGFGLLFNWGRLGDGEHEVVAFVDGVELGRATVWVTRPGPGDQFRVGVRGRDGSRGLSQAWGIGPAGLAASQSELCHCAPGVGDGCGKR